MLGLTQSTRCVQLVVDDGLVQVVSLQAESFDLGSRPPFIHRSLMGTDGLKGLL
ncbi:hypothetical protein I5S78_06795 [Pseudomonas putida]|nr:hypothetical protein [Pseudomonas putida]